MNFLTSHEKKFILFVVAILIIGFSIQLYVKHFRQISFSAAMGSIKSETKEFININTANEELLCSIPGIGPVTADRIVEYRKRNGLFTKKENITLVKGIGQKKFEKIKDIITIE